MIIQEQSVILVRTGGIWKFWLRNGTSKHGEKSINCFSYSHRQRATYRFLSRSFGFENLDFHWLCTAMLSTISSRSVGCQNLNILTDAHLVLTRTFPTMVVLRIMLGIQTYTNRYCMHEVTDSVIFFNWSFSVSTISFAKLGEPQRDFLQGPWHVWFLPSIKEALPQGRLPAFEESLKVDLVAHSSQSIRRCVAMSRLIMWILSIVQ